MSVEFAIIEGIFQKLCRIGSLPLNAVVFKTGINIPRNNVCLYAYHNFFFFDI